MGLRTLLVFKKRRGGVMEEELAGMGLIVEFEMGFRLGQKQRDGAWTMTGMVAVHKTRF